METYTNLINAYGDLVNTIFGNYLVLYTILFGTIFAFIAAGPIAVALHRNKSIADINNKVTLWALALVKDTTVTDGSKAYWYFLFVVVFYLIKDSWLLMFGVTYFAMFAANKAAISFCKDSPLIKSLTIKGD